MNAVLSAGFRRFQWANALAAVQRVPPLHVDRPAVLAVLSIDGRMLTSESAAIVGLVIQTVSELPVAMIDADGVNLPLRGPLGARGSADMIGLTLARHSELTRAQIETFADTTAALPLLSSWEGSPGVISPEILESALRRLQHRWPTVVVNVPGTCPADTIATALSAADHVLLVADRYHQGHGWLYQPGHQLSALAAQQKVTVLTVGGRGDGLPEDTVAFPALNSRHDARMKVTVPTDPESLAMYYRLIGRVYG